jgi:hypothetical protein
MKRVTESNIGAMFPVAVLILSPFMREYAFEARGYSMFAFLFISSCFFLYKALIKSPNKVDFSWVMVSLLLPAMFMTHYITLFMLPLYAIFVVGFHLVKGMFLNCFKIYITLLVPFTLIFLLSFPLVKYHFNRDTNINWIPEFNSSSVSNSVYAFLFGVDNKSIGVPPVNMITDKLDISIVETLIYFSVIVFIVSSFRYLPCTLSKLFYYLSSFMVILTISITAYMSLNGINFYLERYLIGVGALFLVLVGFCMYQFKYKWFLLAIYAVLVFSVEEPNWSTGYRELGGKMEKYEGIIVFDNPLEYSTAKFYIPKNVGERTFVYDFFYQQDFHNWLSIGYGEALKELPEEGVLISTKSRNGELLDTAGRFKVYSLKDF